MKVESGCYENAGEVVGPGLQKLQHENEGDKLKLAAADLFGQEAKLCNYRSGFRRLVGITPTARSLIALSNLAPAKWHGYKL